MVEPSARYEDVKIPLPEPVHGLTEVSAVLGIPEWWPTGSRVAIAIAHGSTGTLADPMIEYVHRQLTERKFLTLRFNFPFAEAGKRSSSDSPDVLERTYKAALALLGRDPTAAPAHMFMGGLGLGGRVAAQLATGRVRVDGLFFLGFPLHTQDKPDQVHADELYRIISPMLFVQGTRDRCCDIETLRGVLKRVGSPTALHIAENADPSFHVTKKSGISEESMRAGVLSSLTGWIEGVLQGR